MFIDGYNTGQANISAPVELMWKCQSPGLSMEQRAFLFLQNSLAWRQVEMGWNKAQNQGQQWSVFEKCHLVLEKQRVEGISEELRDRKISKTKAKKT